MPPVIFVLLAPHAFDLRADILVPVSGRPDRLLTTVGPDSAPRIQVYYTGNNHYEGSDAEPVERDEAPTTPVEPPAPPPSPPLARVRTVSMMSRARARPRTTTRSRSRSTQRAGTTRPPSTPSRTPPAPCRASTRAWRRTGAAARTTTRLYDAEEAVRQAQSALYAAGHAPAGAWRRRRGHAAVAAIVPRISRTDAERQRAAALVTAEDLSESPPRLGPDETLTTDELEVAGIAL